MPDGADRRWVLPAVSMSPKYQVEDKRKLTPSEWVAARVFSYFLGSLKVKLLVSAILASTVRVQISDCSVPY